MSLVTLDQAQSFGYDPQVVAPMLRRAETRVLSYVNPRLSAQRLFAETPIVPDALIELVFAVALRMASVRPQVVMGVTAETSGQENVSYGSQAFAGVSDLTDPEKKALDGLFPPRAGCFDMTDGIEPKLPQASYKPLVEPERQ